MSLVHSNLEQGGCRRYDSRSTDRRQERWTDGAVESVIEMIKGSHKHHVEVQHDACVVKNRWWMPGSSDPYASRMLVKGNTAHGDDSHCGADESRDARVDARVDAGDCEISMRLESPDESNERKKFDSVMSS